MASIEKTFFVTAVRRCLLRVVGLNRFRVLRYSAFGGYSGIRPSRV